MRVCPLPVLLSLGLLLPGAWAHAGPGRAPMPLPARELSIATVRLPGQDDDPGWEQRREQIARLLATLRPDVVSVQQVVQQGRRNPACWLASRLRYSCDFVTPAPPSQARRHGSAMLSRLPVAEDAVTLLHPPGPYSAAGMIRVALGTGEINIYVARLRPEPDSPGDRRHQANDLMAWIAATSDGRPSVVAGEFSAASSELVRALPGFQPSRRNPSTRIDRRAATADGSHGLDVLFQVKAFSGLRQQRIELPAEGGLPALPLGMMAVLQLQEPAG